MDLLVNNNNISFYLAKNKKKKRTTFGFHIYPHLGLKKNERLHKTLLLWWTKDRVAPSAQKYGTNSAFLPLLFHTMKILHFSTKKNENEDPINILVSYMTCVTTPNNSCVYVGYGLIQLQALASGILSLGQLRVSTCNEREKRKDYNAMALTNFCFGLFRD